MSEVPALIANAKVAMWRGKDFFALSMAGLAGPLVMAVCMWGWYGSIDAAIAASRGRALFPFASANSLGNVEANKAASVSWTVQNLTSHPIRLQGSQSTCSCAIVEGLPCSIEPFKSKTVTPTIMAGSKPGPLGGSFALFTDDIREPSLQLGYAGQIVAEKNSVVD